MGMARGAPSFMCLHGSINPVYFVLLIQLVHGSIPDVWFAANNTPFLIKGQ
jgi:hypothetical protein